jgi:RimJ/RimL family protein N-acetyltransferase
VRRRGAPAKIAEVSGQLDGPRLRIAQPADAAALMALKQQLDHETSFMLLEPGERDLSAEKLADELAAVGRSGNSVLILAEQGDKPVGYVELVGGEFRRNRAVAHVIIGVLAEASGKGIGTRLLEEAKRWAAAQGLHRLELNVMAHNHRAIALYERVGFAVEGRRSQCLLLDGKFADELYMGMLLPGKPTTLAD